MATALSFRPCPVAGLIRPAGLRETGRLLPGRRRCGPWRTPAAAPQPPGPSAPAAPGAGAAWRLTVRGATEEDRRQLIREAHQFMWTMGGFCVAFAALSLFTGDYVMTCICLVTLAVGVYIYCDTNSSISKSSRG